MTYSTKSLRATLFSPTTSLSGNEAPTVFRGENLVLRGASSGNPYFEVYPGDLDLNEDYDLTENEITGTVSYSPASDVVVGSSTVFTEELHLNQHILAGTQVLQVKEIIDDTHFICKRIPDTTESNKIGYRLPQLSELDGKRCVMMTGSAVAFGKGNYIAAGSGEMFINGEPFAGESLIATARPQAAIYQPSTDDYIIESLGFDDVPPKPTIEMIAGGTKGMKVGNKHSFLLSYWTGSPEGTDGYSNPCEPVKLDIASAAIAIGVTNNKFRMDLTTSLVGMPDNAKGFIIWGSQSGKETTSIVSGGGSTTVTSPNETLYNNGPWYKIAEVLTTDLLTGDLYEFEYLDGDVGAEVTGNNDRPPGCEYVIKIDGRPAFVSCFGKATTTDGNGSNPGPSVVISKFDNPDAAPTEWTATVDGTIVGFIVGAGRWFMLTSGSLEFIFSTGLFGQLSEGGNTVEQPIANRPYWKTGASNRYSIVLIEDTLFGRSGGKFFQSIGSGDENTKKYDFGLAVSDITGDWVDGYVLSGNDPTNTQACFFHTAAYKNDQGYWVSEILPYSLNGAWLPKIVLSSPTQDMIVSGIATVDEKLEFLCGGRVSDGSFVSKTYRFAAGNPDLASMPWYLLWQISDDGLENVSKAIHSVRLTGKFTDPVVQIHGARPGGEISVSDMEDGSNSISGDIEFANSTDVTRYLKKKVRVKNLGVYALRIEGDWNGSGNRDRLDELVIEVSTHGKPR